MHHQDTPWVNVFAYAGNRYVKDGDMRALLDRIINNKPLTSPSGGLNYIRVYKKNRSLKLWFGKIYSRSKVDISIWV